MRTGLPNVGPDILTQRLKDLDVAGIVGRRRPPPPAASTVYELTAAGRALAPVPRELGVWGAVYAALAHEGMCMSLDAHVLSLPTLFQPDLAGADEGRFALHLDGEAFHAIVAGGALTVDRGPVDAPDATITGSAADLIDVTHARGRLADTALELEGDVALAERLLGWARCRRR